MSPKGEKETLTNDEVRDILKRASRDTREPAGLEGAGVLEPEKALRLTLERLLRQVERTL